MLVVSIVSHGHGEQALALLRQIGQASQMQPPLPMRVVLTLNLPEPELAAAGRRPWPFDLVVQANARPQGFGANHNQAFARHAEPFWATQAAQAAGAQAAFAVLNPDVTLLGNPWPALMQTLAQPQTGCVWPRQLDADGLPQDHERLLPTPASIAARAWWQARRRLGLRCGTAPGQPGPDAAPDWSNAAFWLVRAQAWRELGGFDTRYFMYGEDVDFCLRLQLAGWRLARAGGASVIHAAQRASHRSGRHLAWHLRSLLRLWTSPVYASYRRMQTSRKEG